MVTHKQISNIEFIYSVNCSRPSACLLAEELEISNALIEMGAVTIRKHWKTINDSLYSIYYGTYT
jgi:hypothetical protein